jgi:hypothetical protein
VRRLPVSLNTSTGPLNITKKTSSGFIGWDKFAVALSNDNESFNFLKMPG